MSKIFKIFSKQKNVIRQIIGKYAPNASDIEELTQETFVRAYAYELRRDIREPEKFLFRIARNLAITKYRRKENYVTRAGQGIDGLEVIIDEGQVSPEDHLDACQRLAVFVEALEAMPRDLRETMIMRRIDGLTVPQIATRLNLSVSGVERRLAKAMVLINAHIRKKGLDPADFGAKRMAISPSRAERRRPNRGDRGG